MRFLMTTTAGDPPDEQMMADMGKFVAELSQAGERRGQQRGEAANGSQHA